MRLDSTEVNPRRGRARAAVRLAEARRSALRRSAIEVLERRTLLATLPAPTVDGRYDITGTVDYTGIAAGAEYNPHVAVDPTNPLDLVTTWQGIVAPPQVTPGPFDYAGAAYSIDGGKTWEPIRIPGNIADPTTSDPILPFFQVGATGVAFGPDNQFYIMTDQLTGPATATIPPAGFTEAAGAIVVTAYDFAATGPTEVRSTTVDEWDGDGFATDPTLSVDANLPSFTDTDSTGATRTQTDTTSGNIYVGFEDTSTGPAGSVNGVDFVPTSVQLLVSSDDDKSFTPATSFTTPAIDQSETFGSVFTPPGVTVSQGTSDGRVTGGQVTAAWTDTNADILETNALVNPTTDVFTDNTIAPITDALTGTPSIPQETDIPLNVDITDPRFTTLTNLTATLNIVHPNLEQLEIILEPPASSGLQSVTLFTNQENSAGVSNTNIGISGGNLGVLTSNGLALGTTFDATAYRDIVDINPQTGGRGAAAPFIGRYRPEERLGGASLASYDGSTAATLDGTWTLRIIDNVNGGSPAFLENWSINVSSGSSPTRDDVTAAAGLDLAIGGAGGDAQEPITPSPVLASDNTLGAFSQFEGRLYLAYVNHVNPTANPSDPADDGNIELVTSDNGGESWSLPVTVNDDDSLLDGETQSDPGASTNSVTNIGNQVTGRAQFQPEVAVDQTTGTLAVSWLDTRYDASDGRTVDEIATSIDGGKTFSPNEYVNVSQTATDAATGETVVEGPIPDNLTADADTNIILGTGENQGLAFEAGQLYPVWSSNQNTIFPGTPDSNVDIWIAPAVTAAGPRVIASTMGPVGGPPDPDNPYPVNLTRAADGTPQASAFVVTFDRPVNPATFTTEEAQVFFRDTTAGDASGRTLPIIQVIPLDAGFFGPADAFGAENFEVVFQASSAVGTYSYTVGPDISDAIVSNITKVVADGSPINFPSTDVPVAIPDVGNITSTLTITGVPANEVIDDATVNFSINHTNDSDLLITLTAPDGTTITLVNHEGGTGQNFTNTTLDDAALLPVADGVAPFTGSFVPEQSLTGLVGKSLNGTWTLHIDDTVPLNAGTLLDWSLNLTPGVVSTAQSDGNLMDQDANAIGGELPTAGPISVNDVYAAPDPENGVLLNTTDTTGKTYLLVAPYASDTLPIIVPGPVVQSISSADFNGPRTFDGSGEVINPDADNDSTIAVPDYTGGTITALTVTATISYPTDADLTLSLIGPNGESVILAQGLTGADFTDTTFSDSAPYSITGATAPFTGTFRPQESMLAAFGDITPTGNWTLEITDFGTNSGTLTNWSLSIATDQDALALNKGVSSVDVTFDRDMNPATVTPASVLGITGPDGPIIKPYTYDSTATPQTIPTTPTTGTGTPLDSQLFVNDDGTFLIGHLEVQINVTSTSDLGLTFELKGPDGTTIVLVSGAAGADFTGTNFDDSATATIAGSTAPYTNTYVPAQPLSTFDGKQLAGTWTLVAVNRLAGTTATLNSWALIVTPAVTITPNPLGTDPDAAYPQTYQINFPTQQASGTYTVQLASTITDSNGNALDTNQNAGLALLDNTANAGSVPVVYPSTNVPVTIPASKSIASTISVGGGFVIQTVAVELNITYPNDPDLTAILVAPNGTEIILFSGVGATGTKANFNNTILEDSAPTPIEEAGPPFFSATGYQPQEPLDVLVGRLVAGTYTLVIVNSGTQTGTLNSWSLTFGRPLSTSGLGEAVADQASESFRIFTADPTNAVSTTSWTAVGPSPITPTADDPTGGSGVVSTVAVDPSDPSGNTVYVGGASGGVWKTTDFLTTSPAGPTYEPLTDFGPNLGENIGSIAVFARNNDPGQSIVIAGTGFAQASNFATGAETPGTNGISQGVGFLISQNGGATWSLMDSSDNSLPYAQRDHIFSANGGTSVFKVLVDPKVNPSTGGVIIYAAVSATNGEGGVWRSIDSGVHWTRLLAGNATDLVLDPGSGTGVIGGNLQTIYAGIQGVGVFGSTNEGQTWNLLGGGQGNALLINGPNSPVPIDAPASTPNGPEGRIVLAKPALTGSPAQNLFYAGWLYAAVVMPDDQVEGLYLTKDFGANWTLLKLSTLPTLPGPGVTQAVQAVPTNDSTQANYDVGGGNDADAGIPAQGNYDISLAIDPTNPNIVYLGGTYDYQPTGLIRVDATDAFDAHNTSAYDGNAPGGTVVQIASTGSAVVANTAAAAPKAYLNYYRNPTSPFLSNALLFSGNNAGLTNTGAGVTWTPFDLGLDETGDIGDETPVIGVNVHQILTIVDPLTGKARLLIATDNGVYSVVDDDGTYDPGIGTDSTGGPNKNGNLQLAQINTGAVQASTASASAAGDLFVAGTYNNGAPGSDPDILSNGDLNWTSIGGVGVAPGIQIDAGGVGVDSQSPTDDPGNAGSNYAFYWPCCGGDRAQFFQVGEDGTALIGRTNGLLQQSNAGPEPDPQWPSSGFGANFAVNPVNGAQVIISSIDGRLFRTEDQGLEWSVIGDPNPAGGLNPALDGSYVEAPAFGAPDPNSIDSVGNLDNFIYAGTVDGNIFVSQTGGGTAGNGNSWINITNGDLAADEAADPTPIEQIITDPTPGSHDAYAVTANGIYYNINTVSDPGQAGASTWQRITGNLFSLTHTIFGDDTETQQSITSLNTIAADWRYAIPNTNGGTHPVLYAGGQGGVFRSLDNGATWQAYPAATTTQVSTASTASGGGLPVTDVTDLEISAGNIDPTTGRPVPVAGDPDVLVASTFGRGDFEIRLAPIVLDTLSLDPNLPAPGGSDSGTPGDDVTNVLTPVIDGQSEFSAFGTTVTVNLYDLTPLTAGGPLQTPSPANFVGTATTEANGDFQVQVEAGHFLPDGATDGVKTLGVQAVDQSGAVGNIATLKFTLITVPPPAPVIELSPTLPSPGGSDTGLSPTDDITDDNAPYIQLNGVPTTGIFTLYRDNKLVATVTVTASSPLATNSITIQDPGPVADGTHQYKAQVTDLAGNVGAFSSTLSVTIDTTTPATPPPPVLDPAYDSGTKGDDITNFTQPHFDGTGVPGGRIELIDSTGAIIATANVAANGTYSVAGGNPLFPPSPLSNGTYTYRVVSEDVAGNLSAPSTPVTITIISSVLTTPTLMVVKADNTGPPGPTVITNVTQPRLSGTATAGLNVELIDVLGNITGTAGGVIAPTNGQAPIVVSQNGTFQLQFPSPLPNGTYEVLARVNDAAGNTANSAVLTITIQTVAPTITTRLILNPGDVYGVSVAGSATQTTVRRPIFGVSAVAATGAPAAGTTVDLVDEATGAVIASAVTNAQGNAIETPAGNLPDGAITLVARAVDVAGNLSTASAPLSLQVITAAGDYFGDGVGDLSLFRPSTGQFLITQVNGAASELVSSFGGQAGDIAIQGDFDGDGKIDPAFYRPSTGTWYIDRTLLGPEIVQLGEPNVDIPVPGDYDGDGLTDIAVYRPTTGQWIIARSSAGPEVVTFGEPGDIPVPGDYFGDGKTDLAVYRPSTGQWLIYEPGVNGKEITFGVPNVSEPVPADYDGDGKTDPAIFDPSTGQWILLQSTAGGKSVTLGQPGDEPVPLDYDGDGKADVAVYRPSTGQWIIEQSTAGNVTISFGEPGVDQPVPVPVAYQQGAVSTLSVRSFSSDSEVESSATTNTSTTSTTGSGSLDLGGGASRLSASTLASASAIPPVTSAPPGVVPVAASTTPAAAISPAKARAEARAEAKAAAVAAAKAKVEAELALRAARKAAHAHDLAMAELISGRRS